MWVERSITYKSIESPFIDYFDRLKSIGLDFYDIESKLPQLEKYYKEIVIDESEYKYSICLKPDLDDLFIKWKDYNNPEFSNPKTKLEVRRKKINKIFEI